MKPILLLLLSTLAQANTPCDGWFKSYEQVGPTFADQALYDNRRSNEFFYRVVKPQDSRFDWKLYPSARSIADWTWSLEQVENSPASRAEVARRASWVARVAESLDTNTEYAFHHLDAGDDVAGDEAAEIMRDKVLNYQVARRLYLRTRVTWAIRNRARLTAEDLAAFASLLEGIGEDEFTAAARRFRSGSE